MTPLVEMLRKADFDAEFGALHIIISDGNVDDSHLAACEAGAGINGMPELTEYDRALLAMLRQYSEDERDAAWQEAFYF